jgi:hypothetical protein
VIENAETEDEEPHPILGQLETSDDALPVMHVFWAMSVKAVERSCSTYLEASATQKITL